MDISQAQKATSFRMTPLEPGTAQAAEVPGIEDNQRVDLVVEDKSGSYLLSGDKVSLSELRKAAPTVALEVAIFDRDQDGFLVENELKYTPAEKAAQLQKHAELQQKVEDRKRGLRRSSPGNAGTYAMAADLTLALTRPSVHLYRTPDWNRTPLHKEEQRMSFSSASPAERKSNLTMVGSLDGMPVSPITILRTAR
ncbi:MAG: hypothetical protein AB7I41_04585 [Candidatus Sericytochromatia bacterium]